MKTPRPLSLTMAALALGGLCLSGQSDSMNTLETGKVAAMRCFVAAILLLCGSFSSPSARAQVVNDGATNTLNNVTSNVVGTVTVGTNGSFTLLILTNAALLTNSGNGVIGRNAGANSNIVRLTGANTRWLMSLDLFAGSNGSFNRLVISNGARVGNNFGSLGIGTTSSNNETVVTSAGSSWSNRNDLYVGYLGRGNRLVVTNGGLVANNSGLLGVDVTSSNNEAVVTGSSSLWSNRASLFVGFSGRGNRLVVTNSGTVFASNNVVIGFNAGSVSNFLLLSSSALLTHNGDGIIGLNADANSNTASLSGTNSRWLMGGDLYVGSNGAFNRLVISNGGLVGNSSGIIGFNTSSRNNEALVTGSGSFWSNLGELDVGRSGSGNRLVITNAGTVFASDAVIIGLSTGSTNNRIVVDGGTLRVTNTSNNGRLDVRRGTNLLNAGVIEVDRLLVTNTLGVFEFNGGLLITRGAVISNGPPFVFVVGRSGTIPAVWDVRAGMNDHFLYGSLVVGSNASFNQVLITNGALLSTSGNGDIGVNSGANSNTVFISGAGSRWQIGTDLHLGSSGAFNRLVVSNGGFVVDEFGVVGGGANSSNNEAVVTGAGSVWSNLFLLVVGPTGGGNRLIVTNGGTVLGGNSILVGSATNSTNNRVVVDGGTLRATNVANGATLEVRRGTNVLNAGLIEVDRLLLTNTLGAFEFNGGTLVTENTTNSNGRLFAVGNGEDAATLNLAGNGTHSFANGLAIRPNASLTGNGTILGTVTVQDEGTISPGTSVGRLVFKSSPSLQGQTLMEVSKNGSTLTNDQVQVTGPMNYGGTLAVTKIGPTALSAGDQFPLFIATSYAGSFASLSLPSLAAGLTWTNKLSVNGSIQVVGGAAPHIGGIVRSGTNVIISGTGGTTNGTYFVLASTNVALPLTNWTRILTNQFNASGNFIFTNVIAPGIPQRFYVLQIP